MDYRIPAISGAMLALLPIGVAAQEIAGAATFGLGSYDSSDGFADFSTLSLDGEIDLKFSNGLMFGATAATTRADVDGIAEDASVNTFGLTAGYTFASQWNGGVYFENSEFVLEGFGSASIDSYGLFAGFSSDLMDLEVFGGVTDGYEVSGAGIDWNDLGLSLSYNMGPDGKFGGHVMRSHLSRGAVELDMVSAGLGGHYAFGQGFMGFAGLTHATVEEFAGDITTVGIGVGYDLSAFTNFAAVASLEVAHTRLDDGTDTYDEDSIRLGVTVPLGGAATVPMNSVARSALSPNRTAVTSTLIGAY
jgi:hypothetical protein